MTLDIGNYIGLGQLGALVVLVFRAGQFVQAFKDHSASDDRRFAAIEQRLDRQERTNA